MTIVEVVVVGVVFFVVVVMVTVVGRVVVVVALVVVVVVGSSKSQSSRLSAVLQHFLRVFNFAIILKLIQNSDFTITMQIKNYRVIYGF